MTSFSPAALEASQARMEDEETRRMGGIAFKPVQMGGPTTYAQQMLPQQQEAAGMMREAALGQQPSAAEAMMQRGGVEMQQRLRQALASGAASGRGLGFGARTAAAGQQAAMGAGQIASQVAGQAGQLRAQEMAQARGALAQTLGGMRGADIEGTGLGIQRQQILVEQDAQRLQREMASANIRQQEQDRLNQMIGGAMSATGSAMGAMSDERAKTNVSKAKGGDLMALLDALKPKRFDYKNSRDGGSDNTGIMAQDLEKSAIGRTIVQEVDMPEGKRKMVDMKRALAAVLASSAHLHGRLKKLEVSNA